ncbi:MAG: hypothetical protein ACRC5H_04255 [Treponemataceae bacterium]
MKNSLSSHFFFVCNDIQGLISNALKQSHGVPVEKLQKEAREFEKILRERRANNQKK